MKIKDKIIMVFLAIITLGVYPFILFKKNKSIAESNELSKTKVIVVNIDKLKKFLGSMDNVEKVEHTHTKVKIFFKDKEKIDLEAIRNLKGISGIFISSNAITIIVGNSAEELKENLI